MRFSVLMPVHIGTSREKLAECFESLLKQSKPATEVLVLFDGPVRAEVETCVSQFERTLPIRVVRFSDNRGLGPVLREGLTICTNDLIARVDSDDRCTKERFELQLKYLKNNKSVSVVGGGLREWYSSGKSIKSRVRIGPLDSAKLITSARRRNPFNHQTVMFSKLAVLDCGNYEDLPMFEDYFLWAKMIKKGYQLANLPEILVETDVDLGYFKRRGGGRYVVNEFNAAMKMLEIRFFTYSDTIKFILTRLPIRLLSRNIRKLLYQHALRGEGIASK